MSQMFASATPNVFNGNITSWNTGSVTNMFAMFNGASLFNQNIGAWDVSKVQNMVGMFLATQTFNNGGSPSINGWITSSLKFCYSMFQSCVFNQPIGGWDVSNVVTMQDMFNGNNVFNQDIGSWDVSNVGSFSNFMLGKTFTDYSTTNLNSIYNNWSLLTVQPNLTNVNFGSIKYTLAGQAGKTILESAPNNWQILDGGI
jgi:surface protein